MTPFHFTLRIPLHRLTLLPPFIPCTSVTLTPSMQFSVAPMRSRCFSPIPQCKQPLTSCYNLPSLMKLPTYMLSSRRPSHLRNVRFPTSLGAPSKPSPPGPPGMTLKLNSWISFNRLGCSAPLRSPHVVPSFSAPTGNIVSKLVVNAARASAVTAPLVLPLAFTNLALTTHQHALNNRCFGSSLLSPPPRTWL